MKLVGFAVLFHVWLLHTLWESINLDPVVTLETQQDYLDLPADWPIPTVITTAYHGYVAWNIINFVDDVVPNLQHALPLISFTLGVWWQNPAKLELLFLQCVWYALYFGHWRNKLVMHHLVTGTLLSVSFAYKYVWVGIFVMYVHSISDIPMYLLRYVRRQTTDKKWQIPLVGWTLVSWLYYRLWFMGSLVYYCFLFVHILSEEQYVAAYTCIGSLIALFLLNLFWWLLLVYKCVQELYYRQGQTSHEE